MIDGQIQFLFCIHTWTVTVLCSVLATETEIKIPLTNPQRIRVPLRAWVMADASAHMTAASSADAGGAEMPNVTFSECHITSGLDVTR